jgi:hypothetical protein
VDLLPDTIAGKLINFWIMTYKIKGIASAAREEWHWLEDETRFI